MQCNRLNSDSYVSDFLENLRSKVEARSGCGGAAGLLGEDCLVAITVFCRVVAVDIRWEGHVAYFVEDGMKVCDGLKAQGAFAELSCGYYLRLQQGFRVVFGAEMQVFAGLDFLTGRTSAVQSFSLICCVKRTSIRPDGSGEFCWVLRPARVA